MWNAGDRCDVESLIDLAYRAGAEENREKVRAVLRKCGTYSWANGGFNEVTVTIDERELLA
jgi:hypothetical protein